MGKKDASQHFTPVDNYRKQIGKQEWKKSRKEVKQMKTRADQQAPMSTQQIVLLIALGVTVVTVCYMVLFWYVGLSGLEDINEQRPT